MVGLLNIQHIDTHSVAHTVITPYLIRCSLCERFTESAQQIPLHVITQILTNKKGSFSDSTIRCAHYVCKVIFDNR